jgi:hypothetical protein
MQSKVDYRNNHLVRSWRQEAMMLRTHRRTTMNTLTNMIAAVAVAAPMMTSAQALADPAVALQRLQDQAELTRIPAEIEIAVDRKDWPRARSFFTDQITVDFTSLVGGEPANIPADGLISGWAGNLKGNKQSLHMRGTPLIDIKGDTATVYSNGYAYNKMPGAMDGSGDLWEVWGSYTHEFQRTEAGWKVTSFTFNMTHEKGSMWVKATPGS